MLESLRARLERGQHAPVGFLLLILFTGLALLRVEPIPTYFFLFAWYPALLFLDGLVKRKRGTSLLVDRPLALLSLLCWSLPFWLLFEALNLRVENWYYVDTPPGPLVSRLFMAFAFATVLPGLIETYDLLSCYGLFASARSRPFRTGGQQRRILAALGVVLLALPLLLPDLFFPLIWIFLVPLLEPFNRRPGTSSLLRDLERGRPGRTLRLLAAGLLCGLYWEVMNMPARARWIYTVPFFEQTFGVEMPPIGFLGFAPFALEAYSFLRGLEILGLSVPFESEPAAGHRRHRASLILPAPVRLLAVPGLVALGSVVMINAVEQRTVDSDIADAEQLQSANRRESAVLALCGMGDLRDLLAVGEKKGGIERLAGLLVTPKSRVERILEEARLVELRGIGARNARLLRRAGVGSVEKLAEQESGPLTEKLKRIAPEGTELLERRVRVWIRGARKLLKSD